MFDLNTTLYIVRVCLYFNVVSCQVGQQRSGPGLQGAGGSSSPQQACQTEHSHVDQQVECGLKYVTSCIHVQWNTSTLDVS